jgi:hypothetical protein
MVRFLAWVVAEVALGHVANIADSGEEVNPVL